MVSPEIRVAEKRAYLDRSPVAASNGRDRTAIAWCRDAGDLDDGVWRSPRHTSVWMRILDGSGAPVGGELEVGTSASDFGCLPKVAMDAQGGFFVVWTRTLPELEGTYWVGWFARRFDRDGRPLGAELRLDRRPHYFSAPEIAMDAAGRFTIAGIESRPSPDYSETVRLRRFDASGMPLGPSFELEPEREGFDLTPVLAAGPDGNVLVAWQMTRPEDGIEAIGVRLLDPDGRRVGERDFAATLTTGRLAQPVLEADPRGGFWIVWRAEDGHLEGRRLDAMGHPSGEIFEITSGPLIDTGRVVLVPQGNGLLVFWPGAAEEFVAQSYVQALDGEGARKGPTLPLVSEGKRVAGVVGAARIAPDRFVLSWESVYRRPRSYIDFSEVVAGIFRLPSSGDEPCFLAGGSVSCDTLRNGGRAELISPIERDRNEPLPPPGLPLLGDLDGDGQDELCLVDLPFFACDLDHNLQLTEAPLAFGAQGDTPLLGDVNGDGRDDLCVVRADGFRCDTAHDGGSAEVRIAFGGQPGATSLLGDVDGDGDDDPCVYLHDTNGGRLLCDTAHDGLAAELEESFGSGLGVPFLGDVDGDGRDELCVREGHAFLCDTGHDGGAAELTIPFDRATGVPFFGNADGF